MPTYTLSRNYLLRTTRGHVIRFEKGKPVYVPPIVEKEAIAIGAERTDGGATDPLEPERPKALELSGEARAAEIRAAFELVIERNDPKDFTGAGVPMVKAIERITGLTVDRHEVTDAWAEFKVSKAG